VDGKSLHRLFQLDIKLSSRGYLAHLSEIVLQEAFVQGVSNLQPTDECERRDLFTAIRDFDMWDLKEVDVELEDVSLPYLDGEEVMAILLVLLARGILGEECLGHLHEIVRRAR